MAKPTFAKLKLTLQEPIKKFNWGEQEIEVKQYISIQDKLNMISEVLNAASDQNRFYNPGKINMFFTLKTIDYYTNLSITEKQKENPIKLYDDFMSSGFYRAVFKHIPEDEIGFVYNTMMDSVEQIYKYQNSAYGILDAINNDYNNLNLDIQKLTQQIADKENVEFLSDVMSKLG